MTGPHSATSPAVALRADAGSVRLGARDVTGLLLCGEQYGAPYDLLATALAVEPALPARARHGRPARHAVRAVTAAAVALLAVTVVSGTAAAPAIAAGAALWWVLTGRADLAPPPGR
jgi:hypothetical protein